MFTAYLKVRYLPYPKRCPASAHGAHLEIPLSTTKIAGKAKVTLGRNLGTLRGIDLIYILGKLLFCNDFNRLSLYIYSIQLSMTRCA